MKRKLLTIIPALIFAFVIALNINICIKALRYDTYVIELKDGAGITHVDIDDIEIPLDRYLSEDLHIEKKLVKNGENEEEKEVLVPYKSAKVSIMLSNIDDICINFYGDSSKSTVLLNGVEQTFEDNVYFRYIKKLEIFKLGFNKNFIWLFAIAFVCSYAILYYSTYFVIKLKKEEVKFYEILLFVIGIFLMYLFSFYSLMYFIKVPMVAIITAICGFCIYYLKDELKTNIEKIYLILATFIGLSMMFIIPPFNVPDEGAHFTKSFDFTVKEDMSSTYCHLPESIANFKYKYEHNSKNYGCDNNFKSYFLDFFETSDYSVLSENVQNYGNTNGLGISAYLPSIIIFAICRIIGTSPFVLFMSGRFANLLIMILLCYYALKNLPRFKKVIFVVTLMPMFLHQGMGINQDWLTNSISVAIIAYIIKMKYSYEKIEWKHMAILSAMALVLAYCKFGYFISLLLVFLIPNNKFKDKKVAIAFKVLLCVITVLLGYIQNSSVINMPSTEDTKYYTFKTAIEHPFKLIKMYANTLYTRGVLDLYNGLFDGYGVSTKWLESVPQFLISATCLILILASGNEDEDLPLFDRIFIFVLAGMGIGIIYSSLLFIWTHEGSATVEGLQPRYFVIPALLLYMSTSNKILKLEFKNRGLVYAMAVLFVHFTVILQLSLSYY